MVIFFLEGNVIEGIFSVDGLWVSFGVREMLKTVYERLTWSVKLIIGVYLQDSWLDKCVKCVSGYVKAVVD